MNITLENRENTIVGTQMLFDTFVKALNTVCETKSIEEFPYTMSVKSDKRDINVFIDGKKCFGITTTHMGKAFKMWGNDKNKDTEQLYHMDRVRAKSLVNGDIAYAGNGKNSVHLTMESVVEEMLHLIDVYFCILAYKKDASAFIESAKTEMTEALGETTEETKTEVKEETKEETPKKRRNNKK